MIFKLFNKNVQDKLLQATVAPHLPVTHTFPVLSAVFKNGAASRLGASGIAVFTALCERAACLGDSFDVSDKALAEHTGVDLRTIQRGLSRLHSAGFIEARPAGNSFFYSLARASRKSAPVDTRGKTKQASKCLESRDGLL